MKSIKIFKFSMVGSLVLGLLTFLTGLISAIFVDISTVEVFMKIGCVLMLLPLFVWAILMCIEIAIND